MCRIPSVISFCRRPCSTSLSSSTSSECFRHPLQKRLRILLQQLAALPQPCVIRQSSIHLSPSGLLCVANRRNLCQFCSSPALGACALLRRRDSDVVAGGGGGRDDAAELMQTARAVISPFCVFCACGGGAECPAAPAHNFGKTICQNEQINCASRAPDKTHDEFTSQVSFALPTTCRNITTCRNVWRLLTHWHKKTRRSGGINFPCKLPVRKCNLSRPAMLHKTLF